MRVDLCRASFVGSTSLEPQAVAVRMASATTGQVPIPPPAATQTHASACTTMSSWHKIPCPAGNVFLTFWNYIQKGT